MNLKAIRGGNQRGYSFVPSGTDIPEGPVQISIGSRSVLTRIRESPKVPQELIVIDKRLYKILDAQSSEEVQISPVDLEIPQCTEMTLLVSSLRDVDTKEVVKALSDRIEDLEEHLDGLILQIGQRVDLDTIGVSVLVRELSPHSDGIRASIVSWRKVMKVYLEAGMEGKCFNLCVVTDLGAASKKTDILISSSDVEVSGESVVKRYEAADHLTRLLIEGLSLCDGKPQLASVVFSETVSKFCTFDSEEGIEKDITTVHSRSVAEAHSEWIGELLEDHSSNPSNPSEGLSAGIELVRKMQEGSRIPTYLLFLSSGTYSLGGNPVSLVKENLPSGINLICIGLGRRCEESILTAIADAGKGTTIIVKELTELPDVKEQIFTNAGKEV